MRIGQLQAQMATKVQLDQRIHVRVRAVGYGPGNVVRVFRLNAEYYGETIQDSEQDYR